MQCIASIHQFLIDIETLLYIIEVEIIPDILKVWVSNVCLCVFGPVRESMENIIEECGKPPFDFWHTHSQQPTTVYTIHI